MSMVDGNIQTAPPAGAPAQTQAAPGVVIPGAADGGAAQQAQANGRQPGGEVKADTQQPSQTQQQTQQQQQQPVDTERVEQWLGQLQSDEIAELAPVKSYVDRRVTRALNKKEREFKRNLNELEEEIETLKGQAGAQAPVAPGNPQQQQAQQEQPTATTPGGDAHVREQNKALLKQMNAVNDHFTDLIESEIELLPEQVRNDFESDLTDDSVLPMKRYEFLRKLQRQFAAAPRAQNLGRVSNPALQPPAQPQPQQPTQAQPQTPTPFGQLLLGERSQQQQKPQGYTPPEWQHA